jgi:histidine triad (HIT) family protein
MDYDTDNIFAKILRGEMPAERVYEDEHTLVMMDIMPRVDGHALVIPKTSCRNMLDATPEQMSACLNTVQKVSRVMMDSLAADGISVQQFNEEAGGQVVFHLHYHVLPRKAGDSLRPPGIMGDSAVIQGYANKLRAALAD